MGTLVEEIFSRRLGRPVRAGDTVVAEVDAVMAHDVTGPLAIDAFRSLEMPLWNPERTVFSFDHVFPSNSIAASELHRRIREFAVEYGVKNLFAEGICHLVMVERGFARPGGIVVGADSHSTTYGAMGCFATGMGSTDIGVTMATGRSWFRIPETLRIEVSGELPRGVQAKDLALSVIRRMGAEGANYLSVEWGGPTVSAMGVSERLTLANLSIDFGAKCGLIEVDAATWSYLGLADGGVLRPDAPRYLDVLAVDASTLEPQIAAPPAIDNVRPVGELVGTRLDEVFIGSCTNGRIEDLAIVAGLLAGRQVHPDTRTIIVPGSRQTYLQALERGYIGTFLRSGAVVMNAGCGPCLGRQHGTLGPGERALSTSNRNYPGRMGSPEAEIYLANPAVAAVSALAGAITDPRGMN
jgi:3-isopropylmalate/(R)-2-methylmalate dehydratase large subunit/methanogen homoaconitase large subunit